MTERFDFVTARRQLEPPDNLDIRLTVNPGEEGTVVAVSGGQATVRFAATVLTVSLDDLEPTGRRTQGAAKAPGVEQPCAAQADRVQVRERASASRRDRLRAGFGMALGGIYLLGVLIGLGSLVYVGLNPPPERSGIVGAVRSALADSCLDEVEVVLRSGRDADLSCGSDLSVTIRPASAQSDPKLRALKDLATGYRAYRFVENGAAVEVLDFGDAAAVRDLARSVRRAIRDG